MLKELQEKVLADREELFAVMQRLIQIRSYSGQEEEVVTYIMEKMAEFGFDEVWSDGLGNAIGRIGDGPVKIMWDAHIDTVKVTENERWKFPPFEGKIADGKIYGRGVVDEKAAMAGYLFAGKAIKEVFKEQPLPFTLYVVGSVLEEDCDGYPLRHIIEKEGIKPDYVLLGEPTDLRVYRGQRGRMEIEIATYGKSAHGAHNQQGVNAVYKMAAIVKEIEQLDKNLQPVEPLGKGSATVSDISSKAPSLCSVPDYCRIHIDRRLTVGEDQTLVLEQFRQIADRLQIEAEIEVPVYHGKSWKGTEFEQEAYFPTWILEEEHPLVKAGLAAAAQVLGQAQSGVWSFSTNGVATAGRHHIPTIGFAPGKEELSHSDREELVLDDLLKAAQVYAVFPFTLMETINRK
ncbi:MAG TPA: YgeY family selenium metabolism-linked hydrolase [Caldithrix abyssi]|uniref:YgeY family selenium metabolism-linked hydrolase n=1 Tax=Caldithrix abyssi TaxID=187145 RepID=A0A7V5UFM2_CALAY|nr:YgeY family selenium metabolism-linked hydrolase [Caldithrix abyssi]